MILMSDNTNTINNDHSLVTVAVRMHSPKVIDVAIPGGTEFVNLKPYATKADTYTKAEVDDKVNGVHVDLSNYYNKQEVDAKVQALSPDLSSYATKTEVEEKVSTVKGLKGDPGSGGGQVTSQPVEIYEVIWGNAKAGAYGADRGYLAFDPLTGWGYLHFDFILTNPSGNGGIVAQLPPNAPVAVRLIEKSVNVNNNSVYVERNSRIVKAWGVPANTRYIIDIIGFWRKG